MMGMLFISADHRMLQGLIIFRRFRGAAMLRHAIITILQHDIIYYFLR